MAERTNYSEKKAADNGRTIKVISPLNGQLVGEVPSYTLEEAKKKLAEIKQAQVEWAKTSFAYRRKIMRNFLKHLSLHAEELAELLSRETGKTLYESTLFEVMSLIHLTAHFANHAEKILKPKRISISLFKHRASYLHYRPRGVILIISPWNFPVVIPGGEVIMSLMAGNGVLLKPASLTPLVAYKIREFFDAAGLDKQLFQVVSGPGAMASQLIDYGVDYVNFTGSTEVGKKVAELCARKLIPYSMELGGKAPFIVCEDADVELAARTAVWGAFANSGQICASVERVYVHQKIYQRFIDAALSHTQTLRQGDPFKAEVDVGAMTDARQIEIIEDMLADAKKRGAKILSGGQRSSFSERFFEPTMIIDADETMKVGREESFGSLLTIMKVRDDEEAIRRANQSRYGLLAYVFSSHTGRARQIAERIEAGTVMINEVLMTHAFPEAPWQGVKESGIGRVHSEDGLRDLSYGYHVNYDLFPLNLPVRYPYSLKRAKLFLKAVAALHLSGNPRGLAQFLRGVN